MSREEIEKLKERIEKLERKEAIQEGVKKALENEKNSIFKSILFFIRIITALIVLSAAGDQAMDYHWVKRIIE